MTEKSVMGLLFLVIALAMAGIVLFWVYYDRMIEVLKELLKGKDERTR